MCSLWSQDVVTAGAQKSTEPTLSVGEERAEHKCVSCDLQQGACFVKSSLRTWDLAGLMGVKGADSSSLVLGIAALVL